MEAVRLWLDGAFVRQGEALHAVDGSGNAIAGTRIRPIRESETGRTQPRFGPSSLGGHDEGLAFSVLTDALTPGVHSVATQILDAQTGETTGAGPTLSFFLNTAPRGVAGVAPVAALVSGKLRFTYGRVTG